MKPKPLTPRHLEVVELMAQGKTSKEIAASLGISIKTVENHRLEILRRLDVNTCTGAVSWYLNRRIALLEAFIERNNLGAVVYP